MTLFGEYLLDKKLVTEAQLVQALLEQTAQTPSLVEIVHQLGLLESKFILQSLTDQIKNNIDFKTACIQNKFWSDEIELKSVAAMRKARSPLGQILVKNGVLEFDDLTSSLDDFLKIIEKNRSKNSNETESSTVIKEPAKVDLKTELKDLDKTEKLDGPKSINAELDSSAEVLTPTNEKSTSDGPVSTEELDLDSNVIDLNIQSKIDLNFEFSIVDPSMLFEYLELVNEETKTNLENWALIWEAGITAEVSVATIESAMRESYRIFHTMKGSARFIKAAITEKIIHMTEENLEFCQRHLEQVEKSDLEQLTNSILSSLDLIWDLRETLKDLGTEESFWLDDKNKERLCKNLEELDEINHTLMSKNLTVDLDSMEEAF